MTATVRITLVERGADAEEVEPLVEALGNYAGAPVGRVPHLGAAEPGGFFLVPAIQDLAGLLAGCGPELAAALRPRLITFSSGPADAVLAAELDRVAGVVDRLGVLEWAGQQGTGWARGPAGLRRLAEAAGAGCTPLFRGEDYCMLVSEAHDGLPHLLADYLRAYEAAGL